MVLRKKLKTAQYDEEDKLCRRVPAFYWPLGGINLYNIPSRRSRNKTAKMSPNGDFELGLEDHPLLAGGVVL